MLKKTQSWSYNKMTQRARGADNGGDVESEKDEERKKKKERDKK